MAGAMQIDTAPDGNFLAVMGRASGNFQSASDELAEEDQRLSHELDAQLSWFSQVLDVFQQKMKDNEGPRLSRESEVLLLFAEAWTEADVSEEPWDRYRGYFGEPVAMWVELIKPVTQPGSHRQECIDRLSECLFMRDPSSLRAGFQKEPFTGQTILMQAVANGDEAAVERMLKHATPADLSTVITGKYVCKRLACPILGRQWNGVNLVTVAAIAPLHGDVAVRLVQRLIEAGVPMEHISGARKDATSLMQVLSTSMWQLRPSGDGSLINSERLEQVLDLVIAHVKEGAKGLSRENEATFLHEAINGNSVSEYSPLLMAAAVGNEVALFKLIGSQMHHTFQWGHRRESRVLLSGLDCASRDHENLSVLEMLVLNKHRRVLMMVLFVHMVQAKWARFGCTLAVLRLIFSTFLAVALTLGNLPPFHPPLQIVCRDFAMLVSGASLVVITMNWWQTRNVTWFKLQSYMGDRVQLGTFDTGTLQERFVLIVCIIVSGLHLWELRNDRRGNKTALWRWEAIVVDTFCSILVYVSWLHLFDFLKLFEVTSAVTTALTKIVKYDIWGWAMIYGILVLCTAGAMRISAWHWLKHSDQITGTVWRTVLTLEEATHGPDVQWRHIVMNQGNFITTIVFFLIFLWLATIIMFNVLIALFSTTFSQVSKHNHVELHYWRAVHVIHMEKSMPLWMHKRLQASLVVDTEQAPLRKSRVRKTVGPTGTWMDIEDYVGKILWNDFLEDATAFNVNSQLQS